MLETEIFDAVNKPNELENILQKHSLTEKEID